MMVGAILLSRYTFIALTTVLVVLGMLEFYRMTIPNIGVLQKVLGILCGAALNIMFFIFFFGRFGIFPLIAILLFLALFMAIFISLLYVKLEKPFEVLGYAVLGVVYIALPFALMNIWTSSSSDLFLEGIKYSGLSLIAYFVILWSNDVGAYCFGMTIGRIGNHKLFPRHSPKKTWEGFIGGVLVAMLAGYLLSIWMFGGDKKMFWIGMGLIVSIFGTFGDLIESMLKRSVGVKDSGSIMPGHGGILDRFDGVLLSFIPASMYMFITTL
jgi:phosphatidate cytidylyltransferase